MEGLRTRVRFPPAPPNTFQAASTLGKKPLWSYALRRGFLLAITPLLNTTARCQKHGFRWHVIGPPVARPLIVANYEGHRAVGCARHDVRRGLTVSGIKRDAEVATGGDCSHGVDKTPSKPDFRSGGRWRPSWPWESLPRNCLRPSAGWRYKRRKLLFAPRPKPPDFHISLCQRVHRAVLQGLKESETGGTRMRRNSRICLSAWADSDTGTTSSSTLPTAAVLIQLAPLKHLIRIHTLSRGRRSREQPHHRTSRSS